MEDIQVKNKIRGLVNSIIPYDQLEKDHIRDIDDWISSGVPIFRIKKDAIPPKHLVSYALVIDPDHEKVLLFDHKKAKRMLPSGGHIEMNEMPLAAAKRELKEELGLSLEAYSPDGIQTEVPFFVTVTQTVGISEPHTDVSLWYLFTEDSTKSFQSDGTESSVEFDGFHWLGFDEIMSTPIEQFDLHMHRLIMKIRKFKNAA
ncbi:MAG: NUDIX domain-containing protein [bacterium]